MLSHTKALIQAPRESNRSEGGAVLEDEGDQGTQLFEVDGEEVDIEELKRGYKGTKATTTGLQDAAKRRKEADERMALADRRLQEADERERKLNASRDDMLTARDKPAEPARPGIRERLKEIDFIGTENAGEQVGSLFEEELTAAETRHQKELADLRNEFKGQLDGVNQKAGVALRTTSKERVERQNDETFDRVLEEQFPGVKLNASERAAAEKKYRQKIGPDYGSWSEEAAAWVASDAAAADALWSTPDARKKIAAAESAQARGEGLTARERGERATESTPGRASRPRSGDPDQQLAQTVQDLREGVAQGRISSEQAQDRFRKLPYAQQKRYRELQNEERNRVRAETSE